MHWETRGGDRFRVVDEQVLLTWWRARLDAWPTHQYRLRALAKESGTEQIDPFAE